MTEPIVSVEPDADSLATAIADRLLGTIVGVQKDGRTPSIALTGGTIADAVHREVARRSIDSAVDWRNVDLYWGDERFVAADSPDRNAVQTRMSLLDHVDVDPSRVHEMPASGDVDLDAAAAAYGAEIRTHGTGEFDVVMLGVGPDGHIASLFPGFPQLDVDDAIAVGVTDAPKPPPDRITLTFGALNRTKAIWFLVSGDGKADAVARALAGADLHEIPATGVRGSAETRWLLDRAAASRLHR